MNRELPYRIAIDGNENIYSDNILWINNYWTWLLQNYSGIESMVMRKKLTDGTFNNIKIYVKE